MQNWKLGLDGNDTQVNKIAAIRGEQAGKVGYIGIIDSRYQPVLAGQFRRRDNDGLEFHLTGQPIAGAPRQR
jgi:hypothetical protein